MFAEPFYSFSFAFSDYLIISTWDGTLALVERVVMPAPNPLIERWFNALSYTVVGQHYRTAATRTFSCKRVKAGERRSCFES